MSEREECEHEWADIAMVYGFLERCIYCSITRVKDEDPDQGDTDESC